MWTGAENLAYTGIRFLDRPARSESLYRLRLHLVPSLRMSGVVFHFVVRFYGVVLIHRDGFTFNVSFGK